MNQSKARAKIVIARDRRPDHAHYTVVTPRGWCFEPGRHTHVVDTREEAEQAKRTETIVRCKGDCDCWSELEPCGGEAR